MGLRVGEIWILRRSGRIKGSKAEMEGRRDGGMEGYFTFYFFVFANR